MDSRESYETPYYKTKAKQELKEGNMCVWKQYVHAVLQFQNEEKENSKMVRPALSVMH